MSGHKVAGCCAHVAAIIYYLSYAKNKEFNLNCPAEYLNKVFINRSNNQLPNQPMYVKNERKNKVLSSSESDDSSDESVSDIKSIKEENSSDTEYSDNDINAIKVKDHKLKDSIEIPNEKPPSESSNVPDNQFRIDGQLPKSDEIDLNDFKNHVPPWGARINFRNYKNIHVTNTCSIDYFLFALWVL
jgi:hypothetical protein